jgi:methylase of polypeptide subunit release factors
VQEISDTGLIDGQIANISLRKSLGAFYTGKSAADRLVEWAIRDGADAVLDPSCGDGVFLDAANSKLRILGCGSPKVYGVDVSADALKLAHERLETADLVQCDFFSLTPHDLPSFDSVVGNPPFIRYQTFNGDKESLGHQRAKQAGVKLPRLASSWAPFVVHASRFLRRGGRLGMVMPTELGHAMYARDVLRYLVENFQHVAVEMFRNKMFENLSQSTVLLFCDGYGEPNRAFIVASSDDLQGNDRQVTKVDVARVKSGQFRFNHYLIPRKTRSLYESLAADPRVERLGDAADVGIGYVTGANDFFHLSAQESAYWKIPKRFLRPCLVNLRGFEGIEYTQKDWMSRRERGEKVYLLALPSVPADVLPTSVQAYLRHGESKGFTERYKCRVREFWHAVPHVRIADAFLSYMSGKQPVLVNNAANLIAPNTLHVLRFGKKDHPLLYAASWRTSLTRLSCELEGHALGGGLFKLEPSEAGDVLVVRPRGSYFKNIVAHLGSELGTAERFSDIADRYVLRRHLGLSLDECVLLRDSARKIESWRKHN